MAYTRTEDNQAEPNPIDVVIDAMDKVNTFGISDDFLINLRETLRPADKTLGEIIVEHIPEHPIIPMITSIGNFSRENHLAHRLVTERRIAAIQARDPISEREAWKAATTLFLLEDVAWGINELREKLTNVLDTRISQAEQVITFLRGFGIYIHKFYHNLDKQLFEAIKNDNQVIITNLLNSGAKNENAQAMLHFEQGSNLWLKQGNLAEAIKKFNEALHLNPRYADAFVARGYCHGQLGKYTNAREDVKQALSFPNEMRNFRVDDTYIHLSSYDNALGRYRNAIKDASRALELRPGYDLALKARGDALYNSKNYSQALNDFNQYLENHSEDINTVNLRQKIQNNIWAESHYQVGIDHWLKQGLCSLANVQFNEALRLNPEYADAYVARGYCHGQLGNYTQAVADASQAILLKNHLQNFNETDNYLHRSSYYNALGQYQNAINDANKALELRPGYDLALKARGDVHYKLKNYSQALNDFNQYLENHSEDINTVNLRQKIQNNIWAESHYQVGIDHWLKQGLCSLANVQFNEALRLNPEYADAYVARGYCHGQLGNYTQAVADASQAILLKNHLQNFNETDNYLHRSSYYNAFGQYQNAINDANKALELRPGYNLALKARGDVHYKLKNYSQALNDFNQYLENHSEDINTVNLRQKIQNNIWAESHYQVGIDHWLKQGLCSLANVQFNEALRLNPEYADAYVARGYCHGQLGNYTQAVADASQAILLKNHLQNFNETDNYLHRSSYYNALGQYQNAINDANKALELRPGYDLALKARGDVHYKLKNYSQALNDFNQYLENRSEDINTVNLRQKIQNNIWAESHYQVGIDLWLKQGLCSLANVQFNEALRLNPEYADAYVARGYCHGQLGNYTQAVADASQAILLKNDLKNINEVDNYIHRSSYYNAMGQYQNAINDANKALELRPGYDLANQALMTAQTSLHKMAQNSQINHNPTKAEKRAARKSLIAAKPKANKEAIKSQRKADKNAAKENKKNAKADRRHRHFMESIGESPYTANSDFSSKASNGSTIHNNYGTPSSMGMFAPNRRPEVITTSLPPLTNTSTSFYNPNYTSCVGYFGDKNSLLCFDKGGTPHKVSKF